MAAAQHVVRLLFCLQTNIQLLPSMADLLSQHASLDSIRKIGEGTFGEAFKADQVRGVAVSSELAQGSVQLLLRSAFGQPDHVSFGLYDKSSVIVCGFELWLRSHAKQ